MIIISEYVRELKAYSRKDLMEKFNLDEDSFPNFIKELTSRHLLKVYNKSIKNSIDLNDVDEQEVYSVDFFGDDYSYVFTFVGIFTVGNVVIKSFPKYLLSKIEPFEEMKEILKVLNRYGSEEEVINLYSGYDKDKEFNFLSLCLFILNNYYENGVYMNQEEILEMNGDGEISWDDTINETNALMINKRPFYLELKTKNIINNESDYITRLHKSIITDCCKKLKEANLLELFEIEDLDLSDEELENFGDDDYKIYRIERELNVQFVTWKQNLLKTLKNYISKSNLFEEGFGLSLYGTNNFYDVWEKTCAKVFDNQLHIPLEKLDLPQNLHEDFVSKRKDKLIEIIEKPIWITSNSEKQHESKHTLRPDLISFIKVNEGVCFCIFDAKYYNILLDENKLEHYPGVGDVTKQYLYQLAYNDFIEKHGFASIKNVFLMPTEEDASKKIGKVKINFLERFSNSSQIVDTNVIKSIDVVKLSAKKIFKYYLDGKDLDINKELNLFSND